MRYCCLLLVISYLADVHSKDSTKDDEEGQTFYLIPKTQKSCLPSSKRGPFRMPSDRLQLLRPVDVNGETQFSKVLAFPGCFELTAQVEVVEKTHTSSVIMYHSFKWLQAMSDADVSSLDVGCTGQDEFGCGGTGNRCYYCDICETLKRENAKLRPEEQFNHECPTEVGRKYDYFEERCVNDWGSLDEDKDGTPDFMKDKKYKDYAKFLEDLKIEGYGTMRLTVYLATNATKAQTKKMEEHQMNLRSKYGGDNFHKAWAKVYKAYWLPKLLTENLVGCVNVFFDMCKNNLIEGAAAVDLIDCPSDRKGKR